MNKNLFSKIIYFNWIFIFFLFISVPKGYAQESAFLNFQITVKDNNSNVLTNKTVGARIRIINSASKVYYEEKHTPTTNARGLASLNIGNGTSKVGVFSNIPFGGTERLLVRVDIDANGGSSYTIVSINPINTTVPTALYAKVVQSINEMDTVFSKSVSASITNPFIEKMATATQKQHYVGEEMGGGIVFYVDSTGENGLIVSKRDIIQNVKWMPQNSFVSNANSFSSGSKNTTSIVAQSGQGSYAAYSCDTLTSAGKTDWYLPSVSELSLLMDKRYEVNTALANDKSGISEELKFTPYWSSTQRDASNAYLSEMGTVRYAEKSSVANVRAIRRFSGLYDANNYSWAFLGGLETEIKSNGNNVKVVESINGNLLEDCAGKRGTVYRETPHIKLPAKVTFKLQANYNPSASEPATELFGTGDFRIYIGGPPKGYTGQGMDTTNLSLFEGVQFRIFPGLDLAPIRRFTGTEPHTCTSIWLRYVDPDKITGNNGEIHTGLVSDACQGRIEGGQCGWTRWGEPFENGFGLKNDEEALVTIIISDPTISMSVKDRTWSINTKVIPDTDIKGDILRFDTITNIAIGHTNTSRGFRTLRISDLKVFPLE
jgi:hypothetical protein